MSWIGTRTKKKIIIAFSGWKGSGKTTACEILKDKCGFESLHFADPLKEMVAKQYDIPLHVVYQDKEKLLQQFPVEANPNDPWKKSIYRLLESNFAERGGKKYWTPRALLILEGSVKRSVTADHWVRLLLEKIEEDRIHDRFCIGDLRYPNEIDALKHFAEESNGKTKVVFVRIDRFDSSTSSDPSERSLDIFTGFHHRVINRNIILTAFEEEIVRIAEYESNKLH